MSETILRVDPSNGDPIGTVDRDVAHRGGTWHASVHVWVLTADGAAVLQRRADDKDLFPGRWDVSAAGHVRPGEDGLREVAEELGVAVDREGLLPLGHQRVRQRSGDLVNNEWARVWVWRTRLDLEALCFRDGEVTAVAALALPQLRGLLAGTTVTAPSWDGRRSGPTAIAAADLVPLPAAYWRHVLAAIG